jgi:hypothetical protein
MITQELHALWISAAAASDYQIFHEAVSRFTRLYNQVHELTCSPKLPSIMSSSVPCHIGRTKGGLYSRLHAIVDDHRREVRQMCAPLFVRDPPHRVVDILVADDEAKAIDTMRRGGD